MVYGPSDQPEGHERQHSKERTEDVGLQQDRHDKCQADWPDGSFTVAYHVYPAGQRVRQECSANARHVLVVPPARQPTDVHQDEAAVNAGHRFAPATRAR